MARKKKSKIQSFIIKFILISLIVAAASFAVGNGALYVFRHNDYFRIRSVIIDPSLQFINKRDLRSLIGKNIFAIDLKAAQRRLSYKYPQASDLKIAKHFPDQIAIVAKQRIPFAQIQIKDKMVILDGQGIILSLQEKGEKNLFLIIGSKLTDQKLIRGLPFKGIDVRIALRIAKNFQANKSLSSYAIEKINIENLSKIQFMLSNDLDIIIDRSDIAQDIRILGVVLTQDKIGLKQIKYIDLRFKEPIIGKK